jgi:outer membrane lipoprotein
MKMIKTVLILGILALTGCAHVISQATLDEADQSITFAELRQDPSRFLGRLVILGGVIVKTVPETSGTLLEIYQTRTDRWGEPVDLDRSGGRFLAHYKGFLDSEIWSKGRKVTVAGKVEGEKTRKLGGIDYRYPYIRVREIHLWRKVMPRYESYPGYLWGPWGPWNPWWDPFWYPYWEGHPPYRHAPYRHPRR